MKHFYDSFAWYLSFTKNIADNNVSFFCLKHNKKMIAIVPLEMNILSKYPFRIRSLETPKNAHLMFNGIVFDDSYCKKEIISSFLSLLAKSKNQEWHFLRFTKLISFEKKLLSRNRSYSKILWKMGKQYQVKVMDKNESDRGVVPKSLFKSIRRYKNRLAKSGNYYVNYDALDLNDLVPFMSFLEVEASGWKGASGKNSAIKSSNNLKSFYLDLVKEFSELSKVYIFELILNKSVIAAAYMILDKNTAYGCKIGYDENYSNLAPGKLLHYHILLYLKNNLEIFELNFTSNNPWQREWGVETRSTNDVTIYNNNLLGSILFYISKTKRKLIAIFGVKEETNH